MPDRLDRQQAFSGTRPVDEDLAIDVARLERWLETAVAGFRGPVELQQFRGGQSNPTFLLKTPEKNYVLRRKPPGDLLPSAHAVDREYRVISALGSVGFPVATARVLCRDESVIGSMFYLMDEVRGRIFWEPAMPGSDPVERAAVYDTMNRTLAELHALDPDALGLGDFGHKGGYVARQIARWSQQYRLSTTEEIPEMDRLVDWLPDNLPPENPTRLVHGDYRLDNLIVSAAGPNIEAVLDWELATLGDPVADVAYHAMQWVMPASDTGAGVGTLQGENLEALGIPALDTYLAIYEERTGLGVRADLDFHFAYNFFRLAAIFQGIIGRVRDGTAANPEAARMAAQVRPLAEAAWHYAERAGA
ncbi:phosphotransferase family protein [Rhodobium gokarnense]|uniref:Aminoglycoside phosphotransferase (APT) family kinase protein n=1 Tax=Rhodobium gokarnense TaxID=364296 RepID=A0ABT3HCT8_9HYPH|nr:phosphotransferase family protein [Rhodobium gokarnense]MCW2308185.1 aminoglycoside phosphotransferase (APT) family kinase protein [Rhodobium gokarnense]